jgi:hypothetical protein
MSYGLCRVPMSGQRTEDDVQYELRHRLLVTQASTTVPSRGGQEASLGWAKSDETGRGSDNGHIYYIHLMRQFGF